MSELMINVDSVSKRYSGHVAVEGLSLQVRKGIIYGLLGPNGAGKTTTIRMVNNIIMPDEGRITLFGSLPPGREALRRIGYLPEERGLHQKMTVRRVLLFLAELRGLERSVASPRIESWLARLELSAWIDRNVENLSKGMQQKIQFVATVLHEPDLLILDEPFSGLDPINADVLREIVKEQRAKGRTVVFSTHLMEHAEQLCDDICIIARSKKVLEGGLAAVKAEAREGRQTVHVVLEAPTSGGEETLPPPLRPASNSLVSSVNRKGERAFDITLADGARPQDLLRSLVLADLAVTRFDPYAPTLHEIFIERVGAAAGVAHE